MRALGRAGRHFGLYVIVASGLGRDEVVRRLHAWGGLDGIPALETLAHGESGARHLELVLRGKSAVHAGLVCPDADVLLDFEGGQVVAALNLARDVLYRYVRGPLVLVFSKTGVDRFAHEAFDLYETRAITVTIEVDALGATTRQPSKPLSQPAPRLEDLEAEARELESRSREEDGLPAGTLADQWLALGWRCATHHAVQLAVQCATRAREIAQANGYLKAVADAWRLEANAIRFNAPADELVRMLDQATKMYDELNLPLERALTRVMVAEVLQTLGNYDESLRIHQEEVIPVCVRLGRSRLYAATLGKVADVLEKRGDYDGALRIRRDVQLPIYDRLGDVRERAVALGEIADVLQRRGDYEEVLRIHREEEIPVYERLNDERARAVAMGKIADVLLVRGDHDEALRIHLHEELPVYQKTGDLHAQMSATGKVADVLMARGDHDEALRIYRETQLPFYDRTGDVRARAITLGRIADVLQLRGDYAEALRIRTDEELPVYERLGNTHEYVIALGKVADSLQGLGDHDEALRIRRDVALPIYERLGDIRGHAITVGKIAETLLTQRRPHEAIQLLEGGCRPILRRTGDTQHLVTASIVLAQALTMRSAPGDRRRALRLLDEAHSLSVRLQRSQVAQARIVEARRALQSPSPSPKTRAPAASPNRAARRARKRR